MKTNKLIKISRHNGGLSHHVENVFLYYRHNPTKLIINWLSRRVNNNKRIAKSLDKIIINNFKGLFGEYKLKSKLFIDIGYFKKWDKYEEVIGPLLRKIQELERLKKDLLILETEMTKEEWIEKWTNFSTDLEKWFVDYYTNNIIRINEYEKGIPVYRQKNIDKLIKEFKMKRQ